MVAIKRSDPPASAQRQIVDTFNISPIVEPEFGVCLIGCLPLQIGQAPKGKLGQALLAMLIQLVIIRVDIPFQLSTI